MLHSEAQYARILAPFLQDPGNLFAISSDFCHWCSRFQYTRYDPTDVSWGWSSVDSSAP